MPKKTLASLKRYYYAHPFQSLLVFAIFAFALYLRLEPAIFNITIFSFDQGLDAILVKRLVVDHQLSLISRYSGLEGVFMGPWQTWFMVPAHIFSLGNPNGTVVYFAILSFLTLIYSFVIYKKIFDLPTASIYVLIMAFHQSNISAAHVTLSPSPLYFLTPLFSYFLYRITTLKQIKFLPQLFLLCAFFFQLEMGFAIFALIATILTLIIFLRTKLFIPKYLALSGIVFFIPFLPQIVFDLRHNFLISRSIMAFLLGHNTSLGQEKLGLISHLISRYQIFQIDFFNAVAIRPSNSAAVILSLVVFITGWMIVLKSKHSKAINFAKPTLTFILIFYLGFLIYTGPVWNWYRSGIAPILLILHSLAIAAIYKKHPSIIIRLILGIYLFYLITISIDIPGRIDIWTDNFPGSVSTVRNQQLAIDSIYQDAKGEPFALYVYTPPIYPYIWDYQLYWYVQNKYSYLPKPYDIRPQPNNPDKIYILIEPENISVHLDGFLGHFRQYGYPVATWPAPGDIIIQKWQFDHQPQQPTPLVRFVSVFANN